MQQRNPAWIALNTITRNTAVAPVMPSVTGHQEDLTVRWMKRQIAGVTAISSV